MSLRNRNQIPVCRACHMDKIHKGTYYGSNLRTLNPQIDLMRTGYDVRLVNIENQLKPSTKGHHGKFLEEKGWKITQRIFLVKKYRKY